MRLVSMIAAALALLAANTGAHAQSNVALEFNAPPPQPNTVVLPTAEKIDRELWQRSSGRESVRIVTRPTITAFRPVGMTSPASVIIAPGAAFLGLEMDKEGWEVARWFANNGITAFVLKYRTVPTPTDAKLLVTELDKMITGRPSMLVIPKDTPPEALADGLAAIRYIRTHAADYGIDPKRVGFMGFSAGGFLSRSVVEHGG